MDRTQLQADYIETLLDGMTMDELCSFFVDTMNRDLSDLNDEELVEEVNHYVPELLQD